MKFRIPYLLISLIFLAAATAVQAETAKKVVLVTIDYPPYYAQSLENYGYVSEVIKEAYKHSGYEVEIRFLPWRRGMDEAKAGKVDGTYALWHTKEREQWFSFCDPFPIKDSLSFVKLKSNSIPPHEALSDLKSYTIGTVASYGYPESLKNSGLKFEVVVDDDTNLRKLEVGRLPLIVIDFQLAQYLLKTKRPEVLDKVETLGEPIVVYDQYLGISKATPDYQQKVQAFNTGLKAIATDGTLDKILKKFGFK